MTNNTAPETTPSSAAETKGGKGVSGVTIAIIAVVIVGLLGAGYIYFTKRNSDGTFSLSALMGKNTEEEAVARVNGQSISRSAYNESLAAMESSLKAQGVDLTGDTEIQAQVSQQVLNSLIGNELLTQAAAEGNFTTDDQAVQAEYDAIATQLGGAEALTSQMASVGLTEDELRANIREQLAIRAYLAATIDTATLTASEEEIVAYYDSVELPEGEKPALEEVRTQIAEQIRATKEQDAIGKLIETLRATAEIEVLI